jgi:hypothetical protein
MEVILVGWDWTLESVTTGMGKLSIAGLGEDTVRMIVIEQTFYDDNDICFVDFFSFQSQIDLEDPSSERFAFVLGFTTEKGTYVLDEAFVTLGESTISVSGRIDGESVSFELDAETFELVI